MFTKQILSVLNLTCSGDKHSIIRIVDLAAVYSSGDKLPMLVTDKTKKKKKQGVLRTTGKFLVDMDPRERTGSIVFYSKNG